MPGTFLDSNVLLYLASADVGKADKAQALLAAGGTISVQVLNEVANVARRKMHLAWQETHELLTDIRGFVAVEPVTVDTHESGLAVAEYYQLSLFDSMIVAAALQADCDTLLSEDMQDGMVIADRLRITNPFRA